MRHRLLLAFAILALIGSGVAFQRQSAGRPVASQPLPAGVASTGASAQRPVPQPAQEERSPRASSREPRVPVARADPRALEATAFGPVGARPAETVPVAWRLPGGPPLERRIGDHRVPAEPARLDTATLLDTDIGERLALELPGAGPVEVIVQRISEPAPGTRVIQGHLAELEEDYPVVLTLSARRSFVNVTTPGGTWIGQFEDGSGWLHFDDLDQRLVDHENSDMRLPPAEEDSG